MAKHPKDGEKGNGEKRSRRSRAATQSAALAKIHEDVRKLTAESTPVIRALSTAPVVLPEAAAPSLDGLVIDLDDAAEITPDDLTRAFHDALRAIAERRARAPGETPQLGDDVTLNMLGYAKGALLPFSARLPFQTELQPFPHLPGLAEGITEIPVGEGRTIPVRIPDDYPFPAFRGASARFLVEVTGAVEVRMPDAEHPETLRRLGRGKTLEEVMDALATEIDGARGDELLVEAQTRVLDELAVRTHAPVPSSAIDEEVLRAWGRLEGTALARLAFSSEEQEEAFRAWRDDPSTRAEAERRIRVTLGLQAIAARDGIEVTKDDVMRLVKEVTAVTGLPLAEVTRALRADTPATERVVGVARHLKVVEHVMAHARFRFPEDRA